MSEENTREFLGLKTHEQIKLGLFSAGMKETEYHVIRTELLKLLDTHLEPKNNMERVEYLNMLLLKCWNNGQLEGLVAAFRGLKDKSVGGVV